VDAISSLDDLGTMQVINDLRAGTSYHNNYRKGYLEIITSNDSTYAFRQSLYEYLESLGAPADALKTIKLWRYKTSD
jgi:hypothetical protein